MLTQPQGEGRSRPDWERGVIGSAGRVPRVQPPQGGEIHVRSDGRAVATDHVLERGASEVQQGASKVGGEVGLVAPAPHRLSEDAVERVSQHQPSKAGTELLVGRQRQAVLRQASIEEGVAWLDRERRGGFVGDLEREGNEPGREAAPVLLARRPRRRGTLWVERAQPLRQSGPVGEGAIDQGRAPA